MKQILQEIQQVPEDQGLERQGQDQVQCVVLVRMDMPLMQNHGKY